MTPPIPFATKSFTLKVLQDIIYCSPSIPTAINNKVKRLKAKIKRLKFFLFSFIYISPSIVKIPNITVCPM